MSSYKRSYLIPLAVGGHRESMTRLLLDEYDSLRRYVEPKMSNCLAPTISVEDLLQETFLLAYVGVYQFRGGEQEFSAWLRTIADNRLIDLTREQLSQKRGGANYRISLRGEDESGRRARNEGWFSNISGTPQSSVFRREVNQAIHGAVDDLPSAQRDVVRSHYLDGKSVEETAKEVHRTVGAVRGLLRRARKRLKTELGSIF